MTTVETVTVTYLRADGTNTEHQVARGMTIMQAAIRQGEDGIVAECGGSLMCATCHVYVDPAFAGRFPTPTEEEEELLSCTAAERRTTSRLSCQLVVTEALDGVTVEIPSEQI